MKKIFYFILLTIISVMQLNAQPVCTVNTAGGQTVLTAPAWATGCNIPLTSNNPPLTANLPAGNYTNGVTGFGIALPYTQSGSPGYRCNCTVNGTPLNPQPTSAVYISVRNGGQTSYFTGGAFGAPIILKPGLNDIGIVISCTSSGPGPQTPQPGTYFNVSITLNPPPALSATITPECITSSTPGTPINTGAIKFKIVLNNPPAVGTTVRVYNTLTNSPINSAVSLVAAGTYYLDNSGIGFPAGGTFSVKFFNGAIEIFPNNMTSSYTHTNSSSLCPALPQPNTCIINTQPAAIVTVTQIGTNLTFTNNSSTNPPVMISTPVGNPYRFKITISGFNCNCPVNTISIPTDIVADILVPGQTGVVSFFGIKNFPGGNSVIINVPFGISIVKVYANCSGVENPSTRTGSRLSQPYQFIMYRY